MATLGEILQLLPDVGRNRLAFNPSFWPRAANSLLSIIESEARGPDLYMEAFIPYNGRQTMFAIPATMRKLLRVRKPDYYGILDINDPRTVIPFYPRENRMIQLAGPPGIVPTKVEIQQALQGNSFLRRPDNLPIAEEVAEGWAAIITHTTTDGSIEYRRVLSIDEYRTTVALDGPTNAYINPGDNSIVVDQYMIFEGPRKLARFTDEDSESPLPDEWNRILETGLRWKLEAQSDEDGASEASMQWYQQFRDAIDGYSGDLSERPGDQNGVKPRGGSYWGIME